MKRFEYKILDNGDIEIRINGRDKKGPNGKFLDTFTQKVFCIESKELMILRRAILDASFEWCNKFQKSLDTE